MTDYDRFILDISDSLCNLYNIVFSDAQCLIDLNSFYVLQGWTANSTPDFVAHKIAKSA